MCQIANYDELYRPYNKSGGELQHPDFVKLPVKPKGDGLQILLEYKKGLEYFAIWCLLLEKSTTEKPKNRGKLLNHKEQHATIPEITKSISLKGKEKLVKEAISALTAIGWLIAPDELDKGAEQTSALAEQIPLKLSKDKLSKTKDKYKEFVFLSKEEFQKLVERFGEKEVNSKIGDLNNYIGSHGRKYKSHYFTLLNWFAKDEKIGKFSKKTKLFPITGKTCSRDKCPLPAVYKDTKSNYDHYYCVEHMPEKVKELYE